jgi:type VI secretion system secreted protein VgrG
MKPGIFLIVFVILSGLLIAGCARPADFAGRAPVRPLVIERIDPDQSRATIEPARPSNQAPLKSSSRAHRVTPTWTASPAATDAVPVVIFGAALETEETERPSPAAAPAGEGLATVSSTPEFNLPLPTLPSTPRPMPPDSPLPTPPDSPLPTPPDSPLPTPTDWPLRPTSVVPPMPMESPTMTPTGGPTATPTRTPTGSVTPTMTRTPSITPMAEVPTATSTDLPEPTPTPPDSPLPTPPDSPLPTPTECGWEC